MPEGELQHDSRQVIKDLCELYGTFGATGNVLQEGQKHMRDHKNIMASSKSFKSPPVLIDENDYSNWKQDMEIWQMFTELEKKKQGPAVYLNLEGKARECLRDIKPEELGSEQGVAKIVTKLDTLFEKNKNTQTFLAFNEFHEYRRSSGVNIIEFLVHYEYLYSKLVRFEIKLPEGVQAYFLLKAANISDENERLARATCGEMTYGNMKDCIKKIFGDSTSGDGNDGGVPAVRSEPVFQASHHVGAPAVRSEPVFQAGHHEEVNYTSGSSSWRGRGQGRGQGRGRGYNMNNGPRQYRPNYGPNNIYRSSSGTNPVDREGKILKCFKCGSENHFSRYCPMKRNMANDGKSHDIHITLFNAESNEHMTGLVKECLGKALLDSACTKTVCGDKWLKLYLDTLKDEDKDLVEVMKSDTKFRFGDGIEVTSSKLVKIPALIGHKKVMISTDVVSNVIPLLLSRSAMKNSNMVLNFVNDTVNVLGETIDLECTVSGHYCIPLSNTLLDIDSQFYNIILHTSALKGLTKSEKRKKALKLHQQFAHCSKERLFKLVKESRDFNDKEFLNVLEECYDNCEFCHLSKKAPLRPIVGLPLADRFNQVVCMDLKEYKHNEIWILHLIDSATRYSAACLITTKRQDEIVKNIYMMWISYFGYPHKFMSDNGGEFSNDRFREMNEKLNIETVTTAAEAPFSNGIVERHNLILYDAMCKTMRDAQCEPKVALAWAVSAKNALQNNDGFCPNQLVFGRNINIPSVLVDKLPALESSTTSDIIRKNMTAMHVARQKFIESESSEKIRRALRHKVRSYANVKYSNGDKVYYKRINFKGWKGPGVVLGQDGQFVLLRHGGAYYRVHPCQIMKVIPSEDDVRENIGDASSKYVKCDESVKIRRPWNCESCENMDWDSDGLRGSDNTNRNVINRDEAIEDLEDIPEDEVNETETAENVTERTRDEQDYFLNGLAAKPKKNTFVKFKLIDADWKQGKVLSRQPKQGGVWKNWFNIDVVGEDDPICVNWSNVELWNELPFPEEVVLMTKVDELSQEVVDAKEKEISNLNSNEVYDIVPYTNQRTISSRWVLTEKFKEGERVTKARLVARGFEEDSSKYRKDSPTCCRESLRLVFVTAALKSWRLESIDITAAFLQGGSLEREIFLRPPSDVCPPDKVWRLRRCIYGLNDAPRYWYRRVREVLLKLGGVVSTYDNALYLWFDKCNNLMGVLVSHVDDFAFCGSEDFHNNVIKKLKNTFNISVHETGSFKYLGLSVDQNENGVSIHQDSYISSISPISVPQSRYSIRNEELTQEEKVELKRFSGQMLWVSSQTRPDLSYETCMMGNTGKNPTMSMIHDANKALGKLKSTKVNVKFPPLGNPENLKVVAYSDATYNSLPDGSSQGGIVVFLLGENGRVAPISWQSRKLTRVTKSPLASETLALSEAADSGFLIASMIQEIFRLASLPMVKCFTDNGSLTETLQTSKIVCDKRLRVDIARLREMVEEEEINVTWVKGTGQLADCLTKRGASTSKLLDVLSSSKL